MLLNYSSPSSVNFLTVSELNQSIKVLMEQGVGQVQITGEISNLAKPSSGHIYFTLKDTLSQVKVVMWRTTALKYLLELQNGLQVNILAKVSVFVPRGEYQLVVDRIEAAGIGDLLLVFESLKKELAQEGIFDQHNKLPIPKNPHAIAIITSATGAALQDVLHILKRRRPDIPLYLFPTLVQGDTAANAMIKAINAVNDNVNVALILLVRGGGSFEDLWAFNDRALAYAIFESRIPIITGIGHEIDFTIADFVSDLRAPTPSAAAELACVHRDTLFQQLDYFSAQMQALLFQQINMQREKIARIKQSLQMYHPSNVWDLQRKTLQQLKEKLIEQLNEKKRNIDVLLQLNQARLFASSPLGRIQSYTVARENNVRYLIMAMQRQLNNRQSDLAYSVQALDLMSPLKTIGRGYGMIKNDKSELYTSINQVKVGDQLTITLKDGAFIAHVLRITS